MINFITDPIPHEEARRRIADKPAVARDEYDKLPEEMQARAFVITGIENMDMAQAVRDEIATVPAGADWKKVKKEIAAKISPWFTPEQADARANLLLNHHARAAFASTHTRILDAQMDVFPFRKYRSSRISKEPRESHKALDGIVLPADHPFWQTHTPPWEFGCHCMDPIPLTAEETDQERNQDQQRPPEQQVVLEGAALKELESGTLTRGVNQRADIRTPKERGGTYQWSARDTNLPYEEIRKRWEAPVAAQFEKWADKVKMDGGGSLLGHLSGSHPAVSPVKTLGLARAATFVEALTRSGLAAKAAWTRADLANLRGHLRVENPVQATDLIAGITGAKELGALVPKEIRRTVQDLLDILPRDIANTLPKVQITLAKFLMDDHGKKIKGVAGDYRPEGLPGGPRVRISMEALKGFSGEARRREMRRLLSHELMHWLQQDSVHVKAFQYRRAIASHYSLRTAGHDLKTKDGVQYREGQFWHWYAGAQYHDAQGKPVGTGLEVPSVYFELWESPEDAIKHADLHKPNSAAFRETFALVHSIFNSTTP